MRCSRAYCRLAFGVGQIAAAAMTLLAWLGEAVRPLVMALALVTGVLLIRVAPRRGWPA